MSVKLIVYFYNLRPDIATLDLNNTKRTIWRKHCIGRTAWIKEKNTVFFFVDRSMGMSEDNDVDLISERFFRHLLDLESRASAVNNPYLLSCRFYQIL